MQARRGGSLARLASLLLAAGCGTVDGGAGTRLALIVSADTLRADRLGAYGSSRGLTPHLDALAETSLVFAAAYAPVSHTLPSMAALLTGRYPEELGIWSNLSVLPTGTPTLAERFRAEGWNTAAVVSNWVLREASGLGSGFERYDDALPQLEAARPMPERLGEDTTDAALRALDACLPEPESRCLLWVHYQDPHGPYTAPRAPGEERLAQERRAPDGERKLPVLGDSFGLGGIPDYQALEGRRDVAFYRARYDAEVEYLDRQVGRLLAGLEERGLRDAALVVFTADHGESLGEDDYWFSHGEFLSEVLVHVPLLIRVPGRDAGRRDDVVSLVDLFPTLVGLVLEAEPDPELAGRRLLATGAERDASVPYLATLRGSDVPRFGLVQDRYKYVVTFRDGVAYGRLTERGRDDVDLTAPAPQIAAELRSRLEEAMQRFRRVEEESRGELTDEAQRHLEALGYVDRSPEP